LSHILVSGLINIETTVRVEAFPIEYSPVRYPFYGVNSTVSGVGYNIAKALRTLGDTVDLVSMIGEDASGTVVRLTLEMDGLKAENVYPGLSATSHSVILYDSSGRRQINVDLKDAQDKSYPAERFARLLKNSSFAVLCNINFSRPFLQQALEAGIPIATDVHAIANLDDNYNRDFMAAARILFMSDEWLPTSPEDWVRRVWDRYASEIIVVGMGARGALLGVRADRYIKIIPAVYTRPIVNTIGAGDALLSAFVHFYCKSGDPYTSMKKAMVFASYKIGVASASDGFVDEDALLELYHSLKSGN
jgi:sugar/nucleoside kinase (ribokinase family)